MPRTPRVTRRAWLGIGASATLAVVAGCLGTDDEPDDESTDEDEDDGNGDANGDDTGGEQSTETSYLDEPVVDDSLQVGPDDLPGDGWETADGGLEEGWIRYTRSGAERSATVTSVVYEAPDVETAQDDLQTLRGELDAESADVVDSTVDGADEGLVVRASGGSYVSFYRIDAHFGFVEFAEADQETGQLVELTADERSAYASAATGALATGLGRD